MKVKPRARVGCPPQTNLIVLPVPAVHQFGRPQVVNSTVRGPESEVHQRECLRRVDLFDIDKDIVRGSRRAAGLIIAVLDLGPGEGRRRHKAQQDAHTYEHHQPLHYRSLFHLTCLPSIRYLSSPAILCTHFVLLSVRTSDSESHNRPCRIPLCSSGHCFCRFSLRRPSRCDRTLS